MPRLGGALGSELLPGCFHQEPAIIYDSVFIAMPSDRHRKFYGCKSQSGPCGVKLVVHGSGNKQAD